MRADAKPQSRRDRGGQQESRRQQGGRRPADHGQRGDRRRIAARRGQLAESEIDAPDQAIDQRVGRRHQRVDRRQRQSVQRHLQPVSERTRQDGERAYVAERRRIGCAAFRRRQPIADEKVERGFRDGPAVERQRREIARLARPSRLAKAAGGDMIPRFGAGRLGAERDAQAAPVSVRSLRQNGDPRVRRHERRQRHAAKSGLVRLQRRRAAGENDSGDENDEAAAQAPRLRAASRRCLARLPQTSISHHRRRLFLLRS